MNGLKYSTIKGGGAYIDEAAYTDIGFESSGLAIVAFTEDDSCNDAQGLMVALQRIYTYIPIIKR